MSVYVGRVCVYVRQGKAEQGMYVGRKDVQSSAKVKLCSGFNFGIKRYNVS